MIFSRICAAQLGTNPRLQGSAARLLCALALGALSACSETTELIPDAGEQDARVGPEQQHDSGAQDATDTGTPDAADTVPDAQQPGSCEAHAQAIAAFVAAHRSCETNTDCVIVGDCSHADFQAVARASEGEARALVLADPCAAADGPTYRAVCRAGSCERVQAVDACGSAVSQYECPSGTERFQEGCDGVAPTFHDGCHRSCAAAGDDAACAPGFSCQQTSTNPCPATPGAGAGASVCDACGEASWLCLPAPTCQVELSVAFDGATAEHLFTGRSTELQLWLENRTDEAITFSVDVPCHGPRVEGLGDFDLWQECLAGACLEDPVRAELTLAPREKRLWRSTVLTTEPTDCNEQGLASGQYAPTFALSNVEGATTCGPAPASLLTGSEARR